MKSAYGSILLVKRADKLPAAVELGRRGGRKKVPKGFAKLSARRRKQIAGKAVAARLAKLTPEQRSEIARNAAAKRWGKKKRQTEK
jgi:predicted transglutaminase-like cysteine proteinase